ncbi:MAG: hypothetical protein KF834_10245 [Burkholderiales bacterium]|nr:hypothetical protein [Burkholderiales bacterium]
MESAPASSILRGAGLWLALAAALPAAGQQAEVAQFENLAASPYIHCAFYRQYEIDPRTGDRLLVEGASHSLTHYQRQDGRLRAIDTRRAGAREARLLRGKKYLHFVEHGAGLYTVTTVYACLERDARTGVCINYGAVNARHFDARVLRDPDAVFEALQAHAEPGFCDHSFLHLQEAAQGLRR